MSINTFKNKFACCFKFADNFTSIFNYKVKPNEITCLYGLKCHLTLIIVIGHSIVFRIEDADDDYENLKKFKAIIDAILYLVNLFFVISAILLTRSILSDFKKWVDFIWFKI